MNKFTKAGLCALILPAMAVLTACTPKPAPPPDKPVVEIVERTDLLDMITQEHIFSTRTAEQLGESGLSADFQNIQLTGEGTVSFDLIITAENGISFTAPVQGLISYKKETVNEKDIFSDIRLYWGGIEIYGEEAMVTNLTRLMSLSLEDISVPDTVIDLSGTIGDGGYILSTAAQNGKYAFLYHTPREDGFACFDSNGVMTEKVMLSTDGCHLIKEAQSDTLPLDSEFTPSVRFMDGDDLLATGQKSAWYYNTSEDILLSSTSPLAYVEKDGAEYGLYCLAATDSYTGMTDERIFLAVKTEKGIYQGGVFFDGRNILGSLNGRMNLELHSGKPQLTVPATGLEMDIDFSAEKVEPRYKISTDMLGEKMYVSKDKKYELYPMISDDITHIALKEVSTGKIRFISELGTVNHGAYSGETGFLPDGRVYVLGNDDCCIYTTDMEATVPQYRLSDYIQMGDNINTNLDSRVLVAALPYSETSVVALYYDDVHCENSDDRYYDRETGRLNAVYKAALIDIQGNVTVYNTEIQAVEGYSPVTIHLRGNKLNIVVSAENTLHVLTKGTLDLETGHSEITQEYIPYTE